MIEREPSPASYLITGGAGFIGSHLAEALLQQGHRVSIIDDLSTGRLENVSHLAAHPRFHTTVETIANEAVLDRLVAASDIVVHLAAAVGVDLIVRDPVRVIECNILGTHRVLAAASRYGRKVLLASSSEIYGKGTTTPFREDDDRLLGPTTRSRWCYSTSKAVGEYLGFAYHRTKDLPVTVMRFFNTVGPRQTGRYGMVVPRFVQQALGQEPLSVYGDGSQTRCFCDVADTVRAVIALARCPAAVGSVFNVGSTEEVSILGLAARVLSLVRQDPSLVDAEDLIAGGLVRKVPFELAYSAGFEDMQQRVPDISRIGEVTGWRPQIPLNGILQRVIDSYRSQG